MGKVELLMVAVFLCGFGRSIGAILESNAEDEGGGNSVGELLNVLLVAPHTGAGTGIEHSTASTIHRETTTSDIIQSTTDGSRILSIFDPLKMLLALITTPKPLATEASTHQTTDIALNETTARPHSTTGAPTEETTLSSGRSLFDRRLINIITIEDNDANSTESELVSTRINATSRPNTKGYTQASKSENGTFAITSSSIAIQSKGVVMPVAMCGYPPICDQERCASLDLRRETLVECQRKGAQELFGVIVGALALMIVLGNSLLPIVLLRNREMRTQHNIIKVSLAFADMILGFILLFSVIPNMIWTMLSTKLEIMKHLQEDFNSAHAVTSGSMLTLTVQASLCHLMYLSIERFVAIQWPLWHRGRRTRTIVLQLVGLWSVSILASFIPAAFPENFQFQYTPVLFTYVFVSLGDDSHGVWYIVITMLTPFVATVLFSLATGVIVWTRLRSTEHMKLYSTYRRKMSKKLREERNSARNDNHRNAEVAQRKVEKVKLKPEVAVFITTLIMIGAFCVTILPFVVLTILFYQGYYDCTNYSVPFACAFYTCMFNSLANVIIYTLRDKKFRVTLKGTVKCQKRKGWNKPSGKNLTVSTNIALSKRSPNV